MKKSLARTSPDVDQQFKQRILRGYFVRFHMTLILAAVIASGVLTSRLLLEGHVYSMRLRYPLAILGSYLIFVGLVRIWIWYVCPGKRAPQVLGNVNLGSIDVGGGGSPGSFHFGGGSSGGGGASDVWDNSLPSPAPVTASSSGGSSWVPDIDLDVDDDFFILLLLAALVASILIAGGYLIYAAPSILPEAAWQAVLASTLTRVTKRLDHEDWLKSLLRHSAIPFAVVLIFAGALGWVAHHHCPQAVKLLEALRCAGH